MSDREMTLATLTNEALMVAFRRCERLRTAALLSTTLRRKTVRLSIIDTHIRSEMKRRRRAGSLDVAAMVAAGF